MSSSASAITADMSVSAITDLFPGAADIMAEYGLHCYSCDIGGVETLAEGLAMHGLDNDMLQALLVDLNTEYAEQSHRPNHITVTEDALDQLESIISTTTTASPYITISHSTAAGLQLEFLPEPRPGDTVQEYGTHNIFVCLDETTIRNFGGSTVDYRNNTFVFDEWVQGCCNGQGECGCK